MAWIAQQEISLAFPMRNSETAGSSLQISFVNPKVREIVKTAKHDLQPAHESINSQLPYKKPEQLLVSLQKGSNIKVNIADNYERSNLPSDRSTGIRVRDSVRAHNLDEKNDKVAYIVEKTVSSNRTYHLENSELSEEQALSAQQLSRIKSSLNKSFQRYFNYPRLAQRKGWQGTVKLGVRIESNGQLSQIRLLSTSGFAVLDKAALNSLHQISTLKDVDGWLNGLHLDTVLPVQYKLVDS